MARTRRRNAPSAPTRIQPSRRVKTQARLRAQEEERQTSRGGRRNRTSRNSQSASQESQNSQNEQLAPELVITSEEMKRGIQDWVLGQYSAYLPGFQINPAHEDFNGVADSAVPVDMHRNNWLEYELVYFALDYLTKNDLRLQEQVKIIPVVNLDGLMHAAESTVGRKMEVDERYQELVHPREPMIEFSLVKDDPELTAQWHAENDRRNRLSHEFNRKSRELLADNQYNQAKVVELFLEQMFENLNFDFNAEGLNQFVIPLRISNIHFTTLVGHFVDGHLTVTYKDSYNRACPNNFKTPILNFLKAKVGENNLTYRHERSIRQTNGYDCALFTILNSLDLLKRNAGLGQPITEISDKFLQIYRGFLYCLYEELGLNISIGNQLLARLKDENEQIIQESRLSYDKERWGRVLREQSELLFDLMYNPKNGVTIARSESVAEAASESSSQSSQLNEVEKICDELERLGKELENVLNNADLSEEQRNVLMSQRDTTHQLIENGRRYINSGLFTKKNALIAAGVLSLGLGAGVYFAPEFFMGLGAMLMSPSFLVFPLAGAVFYLGFSVVNYLSRSMDIDLNDVPNDLAITHQEDSVVQQALEQPRNSSAVISQFELQIANSEIRESATNEPDRSVENAPASHNAQSNLRA